MTTALDSDQRHFVPKIADCEEDLIAAQRLRYRVFVEELGAIGPTVDHANRRETDAFDSVYDHLLLVDQRRQPRNLDHVVGVYRLLRSDVAEKGSGYYSENEYDLTGLRNTKRRLLELGRSCVDMDHRGGVAMFLLWNALAEYVLKHQIEIMFGVASYHGTDVQTIAQSLAYLNQNHLAPKSFCPRVLPQFYQSLDLVDPEKIDRKLAMKQTPALIKAYLRLGGFIGDGAYIDRNFNTVDVCLIMDTETMSNRHRTAYRRRSRFE